MVWYLRVVDGLVCEAGEVVPRRATLCPGCRLCWSQTRKPWSFEAFYLFDRIRLCVSSITPDIYNENEKMPLSGTWHSSKTI